jgi:hypothetical protein
MIRLTGTPGRRTLIRVGAGFVVVGLVLAGFFAYRQNLPGVSFDDGRALAASLQPSAVDSLGVAPDTTFRLTLAEPLPLSTVKRGLAIDPKVDFTVRSAPSGEEKVYDIIPRTPLEADRVYSVQFTLNPTAANPDYSWAYQVRGALRVVGTLPGDRTSGVPVNTGIELDFSHKEVNDPAAYFSISPSVAGKWERHRRTLVFVPTGELKPGTVYTCVVKKGLGAQGTDQTLPEDRVFSFETAPAQPTRGRVSFNVYQSATEFSPAECPAVSVGYWVNGGDGSIPADLRVATRVYRYPSAEAYATALAERDRLPAWASVTRERYQPDTSGLPLALTADLPIRKTDYQSWLALPDPLPPGFYLVTFTAAGSTSSVHLQVTDLSSYTVTAVNDTVLWFNSLASGAPLAGVGIRTATDGIRLGQSGADGVARFPTPAAMTAPSPAGEPRPSFLAIAEAPNGSKSVVNLSPAWNPFGQERQLLDAYWTYLYTDRPLYLPSDEVRFWGVLQPIDRGTPEIESATVELRGYGGFWEGPFRSPSNVGLIASQKVNINRHVFSGGTRLPNLRPGYYTLTLVAQGVNLLSQSFEVATYTKPAYQLTLSADKRAVFIGDPVRFTLEARFFEGTPVSGLPLDYNLYSVQSSPSGTLTTDVEGKAVFDYRPSAAPDPLRLERWDSLNLNADYPESGPIWANAGVRVFEKDVALRSEVSRRGTEATVRVRLNRVDLSRINTAGGSASSPWDGGQDYVGAPVPGTRVEGTLTEIKWVATETGQYYDFVEKVVRKTYSYHEERLPAGNFAVTTDAGGQATWSFNPAVNKTTLVRLSARDSQGREIAGEVHIAGSDFVGPNDWYHWYHLTPVGRDEAKYRVGETAELAVKDQDRDAPSRPSGYLFYVARKGLGQVVVKDNPDFSLLFTGDVIPNTNVGGVYFDGRSYNTIYEAPVSFDNRERQLRITVKTDQPSYRPSDKAGITIEVRDAAGAPVDAEVNLCLVDEALYALSGQQADFLRSLYGRVVRSQVMFTRGSHPKVNLGGGGAESGGEGGGERRDFRDLAYFESLRTGADGKATATVSLPDNLTSWRLTYHAFASGVRAGSGNIALPVRLPFFVQLALNETYLSDDQPVIQARAYGAGLPSGSTVSFAGQLVRIEGAAAAGKVVAEFSGSGPAFRPVGLSPGKLVKGSYELKVTGKAAGPNGQELKDTLVQRIEVVDSYLRLDRTDFYTLRDGLRVTAEPGELVTLTFSDQERGTYLAMLWRLVGGGRRVDMKAAALVANRLLRENFAYPREALPEPPDASDLLAFQRPEGGIALLPYGSADLELTAKIAALGKDAGFDQTGLRLFLGRVFDDPSETRERLIVSLYGLAALGDPVLNELQGLARETDLSPKERLYLCLGLAKLGDAERARPILQALLSKEGDQVGPALRLNVSRDPEETIAATSLAAVAAAQLGLPEKDALSAYLLDNVPLEELNHLELSLFLERALPATASEAVSFTLGPEGEVIKLKAGEVHTVYVRAQDLDRLSFSNITGKVGLTVVYRAPLAPAQLKPRPSEASLTRAYLVNDVPGRVFKAGGLVKVTLNYRLTASAPGGPYQIVDFLPSGLKAVPNPWQYGVQDNKVNWPSEVDGQKVSFNVYDDRGERDPKTGLFKREIGGQVVYYARVVSLGWYGSDRAVLQHVKSGEIFAITGRETVDIR